MDGDFLPPEGPEEVSRHLLGVPTNGGLDRGNVLKLNEVRRDIQGSTNVRTPEVSEVSGHKDDKVQLFVSNSRCNHSTYNLRVSTYNTVDTVESRTLSPPVRVYY